MVYTKYEFFFYDKLFLRSLCILHSFSYLEKRDFYNSEYRCRFAGLPSVFCFSSVAVVCLSAPVPPPIPLRVTCALFAQVTRFCFRHSRSKQLGYTSVPSSLCSGIFRILPGTALHHPRFCTCTVQWVLRRISGNDKD